MRIPKNKKVLFIILISILIVAVGISINHFMSVGQAGKWHHCSLGRTGEMCCEVSSDYLDVPDFDLYDDKASCEAGNVGAICFPNSNSNQALNGMSDDTEYLCSEALYLNGYYYCEIDAIQRCVSGSCKDGICEEVECFALQQTCIDNNAMKCQDGKWVLKDDCPSDYTCENPQDTNAYCYSGETWYCYNSGTLNCIFREDYLDGCFETLEECQADVPVVCMTADKTRCVERRGGCLAGELLHQSSEGISDAMLQCSNQLPERKCTRDSDCDDGNICTTDKCVTKLLDQVCEHTPISNCDDKQKCEANVLYKWYDVTETQGGYICKILGIGCTKVDKSYCGLNWWLFIGIGLGLLVVVVIISVLGKKKIWRLIK